MTGLASCRVTPQSDVCGLHSPIWTVLAESPRARFSINHVATATKRWWSSAACLYPLWQLQLLSESIAIVTVTVMARLPLPSLQPDHHHNHNHLHQHHHQKCHCHCVCQQSHHCCAYHPRNRQESHEAELWGGALRGSNGYNSFLLSLLSCMLLTLLTEASSPVKAPSLPSSPHWPLVSMLPRLFMLPWQPLLPPAQLLTYRYLYLHCSMHWYRSSCHMTAFTLAGSASAHSIISTFTATTYRSTP